MKIIEAITTTTHVDAHNEQLAREGIDLIVEATNKECIPIWVQHDPRIPPVGRFVSAEARQLPDGELAVVGKGEIWEPGESVPFLSDQAMPLGKPDHDNLFIRCDRAFASEITAKVREELSALIGTTPEEEVKKAVDPLSILTLGGTFVAGAIAQGFISAMTTDAYNALKVRIKEIFRRRRDAQSERDEKKETLLLFKAFVKDNETICVVDVILTDPSDADLDWFFEAGLHQLDDELSKALKNRGRIQRIVVGIEGHKVKIKYGVRSDAVPVAAVY